MSDPYAYCMQHDQPLDWCLYGVDGAYSCVREVTLRRGAEITAMRGDGEVVVRHLARRGDDVEAWLTAWRDSEEDPEARPAINDMLKDYQRHADTGTPLDAEVRER